MDSCDHYNQQVVFFNPYSKQFLHVLIHVLKNEVTYVVSGNFLIEKKKPFR